MTAVTGAILAGGKGSRMGGVNKALLLTRPGQTTLHYILRQMEMAGIQSTVILAGNPIPFIDSGCLILPDLRRGTGPLGGIEAALLHAHRQCVESVLFLPCDLPAIRAVDIASLMRAARSSTTPVYAATKNGPGHYAITVLPISALGVVTECLLQGERSIKGLLTTLNARPVFFRKSSVFLNLNTPEDMERWERQATTNPHP